MRRAKMGEFYLTEPQRVLANNSVGYTEKPDLTSYLKEFRSMYQSKAGERGIVNKVALKKKAMEKGREYDGDYLLNPCGEAILRDSGGLCNLTEVIIRSTDTLDDLKKKVEQATILGTLQSTLTAFRYLRKVWKDNQEEERLLGVSLTGIMDHPVMSGRDGDPNLKLWLMDLKQVSLETNAKWADVLGIPHSKQLTLVKPSGTVSQLCGTSSGIHPRFSPYYLRRVTQDSKDPLTDLMVAEGISYAVRGEKTIFSFPIKSPESSVCAREMGAIQQLELWLIYYQYWCDGNPSQTVYYTDDEFLEVQAWVWSHWDTIGGLSFFPLDDNIYEEETQPYLPVDEARYLNELEAFPDGVRWDLLSQYEKEDNTQVEITMACSGGACEL